MLGALAIHMHIITTHKTKLYNINKSYISWGRVRVSNFEVVFNFLTNNFYI